MASTEPSVEPLSTTRTSKLRYSMASRERSHSSVCILRFQLSVAMVTRGSAAIEMLRSETGGMCRSPTRRASSLDLHTPVDAGILDGEALFVRALRVVFRGDVVDLHHLLLAQHHVPVPDAGRDAQHLAVVLAEVDPADVAVVVHQADLDEA